MVNATKRKVYTLDARNHGESPHTDDMDYILMANDVDLFCKERNLQKIALIGHSMGGRTAMTFALTRPSMVERLVVVDVSPVTTPSIVTTDNVLVSHINAMDTVLPQLSPDMSSPAARKEADRILTSDIPETSVRQFLLANLQKGERLYEWQFNLKALKQNLPKIIQMHDLKGLSYDGNTLFICGGDSPYVSKRDHGAIKEQFPKAEIVYVKGAGHWVHAEKPAEFLDLVKKFLADNTT
uniref:sn-1-specific diacylglycerol lipase ABHD11 n=1 Tax=Amblyomma parvum TaxID=251391 RepID=A0A023FVL1_AMBPA